MSMSTYHSPAASIRGHVILFGILAFAIVLRCIALYDWSDATNDTPTESPSSSHNAATIS